MTDDSSEHVEAHGGNGYVSVGRNPKSRTTRLEQDRDELLEDLASDGGSNDEFRRLSLDTLGEPLGEPLDDEDEENLCCDPKICKVNMQVYQTVLICLINLFLFADQNLMSPNLTEIARSFNMTNLERDQMLGGNVALGFFGIGAVASLVTGYLTDSIHRILTFAVIVFISETACLATFWVQTYSQFWAMRSLTGIGVGGAVPLTFSLFGDLHHTSRRGISTSLVGISMAVGVGVGQIIAGLVGPVFGWRVPFLIIPVPAFIFAILLVTTTREPKRGRKEKALDHVSHLEDFSYDEKITFGKLRVMLSSPSVVLLLAQGLPNSVSWGVLIVYFNDFIAQEMGIPVQQSTLVVISYGIGIMTGQLFGGWITDRLFITNKMFLATFCCTTLVFAGAPVITMLLVPSMPLWLYILVCIPSGFLAGIPGSIIRALMINVTVPEVRGSAFAMLNLVDDLGKGLGPFFVSLIIVLFPDNRGHALAISMSFWGVGAAILSGLICTLEKDVERTDQQILDNYNLSRKLNADILDGADTFSTNSDELMQPLELELQLR